MTVLQFAAPLQLCKGCSKRLPLTDQFWYKAHQKPGCRCKECVKKEVRAWRKTLPKEAFK